MFNRGLVGMYVLKEKTDPDGPVFFVVEKMGFEPHDLLTTS